MGLHAVNAICSGIPNAFQHAMSINMVATVRTAIYTAILASQILSSLASHATLPRISSTQVLHSVKKFVETGKFSVLTHVMTAI